MLAVPEMGMGEDCLEERRLSGQGGSQGWGGGVRDAAVQRKHRIGESKVGWSTVIGTDLMGPLEQRRQRKESELFVGKFLKKLRHLFKSNFEI